MTRVVAHAVSNLHDVATLAGLLYEAEVRRDPAIQSSSSRATESGQYTRVDATAAPVTAQQYYHYQGVEAPSPALSVAHQAPAAPLHLTPHETQLRARLIKFYSHYNPAALARVDRVMARYKGRDAELWHDLHEKYLADDSGALADWFTVGDAQEIAMSGLCPSLCAQKRKARSSLVWETLSSTACWYPVQPSTISPR